MAGRIKGITVEIGGDTTGLEKALKNVNSTIKNTQSQLKDVNRLLKLDPSNTELLSQKQRALKEAIGATKEKLDSLKQAQEQAKQQLENGDLGQDKYDALQREIIETEQELRRLQEEAASTSAALAKIDEAGKKMEAFGDSVTQAGQKIMPASMAVAGLGAAAVKTAADFDAGMSKVAAISGATGDDLDALRDKAREMGAKTKFSASEAASAVEYMAMAGWKTEDMLSGIEGIMSLAAASGEDLATTSDIVTDALTAFGLSAQDSGHFADILAAASSNANTNVRMMGETFKYCAPIAGALGFSAEDVAEAIGLMANAGIKSTQAGTALRTIMNNLSGEVKITGAALGEVTIATTNADGSMRDLSDILADCRGAFSQLSESERAQAAEALVGKNAMSGFLALMNAAPEDIEKLSTAIDNCDGTAAQMAETMQDNLAGQLTILKSQLEELAISFGEMLMPAIRAIVSKIQAFVDKLNGMSESQRKAILTIGLIVAALGPLLVIIGTLISKVGVAMQGFVKLATGVKKLGVAVKAGTGVFGKLGAALGGISAPVLAIVAVVAVLIAAFKHLWDTNEEFRNAITGIWEGIVSKIQAFCQGIVDRLNALGFDFSSIVDVLKSLWDGLCQFLAPVFEAAFNVVSTVLGTVLDVITGLLDVFIGLFTGNWSQMWEGVKEIFSGIWDGITGLF
ncbi:MAG: phage tail tape measure protein, partial [Oscillospiraceae bacterium]|nr:phage tail tape measure protein [Oscillospiraceae bacterium]